ncbi:MAG: response regulator [Acidobacteriota bacterium]|nr:response regulator [Acidobacteriota bacterium]
MATILIAEHHTSDLTRLSRLLRSAGHEPIGARTVDEAASTLAVTRPALLVAAVQLGGDNGLQLLLRSRVTHPRMASLVTSDFSDTYLESEARQYGASAYLVKPFDPVAFLAHVSETLAGIGRPRRWVRKAVAPGTTMAIGDVVGELVDVSAGGLRFELPHGSAIALPRPFSVRLPSFETTLAVELVWTGRVTPSGRLSVGVSLAPASVEETRAWRMKINALAGGDAEAPVHEPTPS